MKTTVRTLALELTVFGEFPITHFDIITTSTFDVEQLVRSGRAQAGIVYADGELKVDMDFFLLGQARFLTVASSTHELAKLAKVQGSDLKRYRQCVHRSAEHKHQPKWQRIDFKFEYP